MPKTHRKTRLQRGQGLIDYALLLSLITLLTITSIRSVGTKVNEQYSSLLSTLNASEGGSYGGGYY